MTRGPRFFTSSMRPATVTDLPPPKRGDSKPVDRPIAHQVPDAVRYEARQARLKARQRMPGEIQAERLALTRQPHRLAPLGQYARALRGRSARALIPAQSKQIVLPGLVCTRVLVRRAAWRSPVDP